MIPAEIQEYLGKRLLSDSSAREMLTRYLSDLPKEEVIELFISMFGKDESIPVSIFSNRNLSATELVVRYLKEHAGMKNTEIAKKLGRSQQVVWSTYRNAVRKDKAELTVKARADDIPLDIFSRDHTILESIILYCRDVRNLRFTDIARIINRDERTVWTIHARAKRKDAGRKS